MKRMLLLVMVLGVVSLQSCSVYRIRIVDHGNGTKYYFPQKRNMLGEWVYLEYGSGNYSFESAKDAIIMDKQPKPKQITYIK